MVKNLVPLLVILALCSQAQPAITIQPSGYSPQVSEAGPTSDTYTISLDAAPASMVTVHLEQLCDPNQITLAASVVFTPADWSPKTIDVTAIDDDLIETNLQYCLVRHTVESSDPAYDGIELPDVLVTIEDNDCGSMGFLAEDFDHNCRVDFADYARLANRWLMED